MNREFFLFCMFVFAVTFCGFHTCSSSVVQAYDVETLEDAMRILQPYRHNLTDERASRLARLFAEAGEEYEIDPKLLVAISYRESSFLKSFEERKALGKVGEIGLMQCHGACLRFRPFGCSSKLEGARCQIQTGTRYLDFARRECPGSTWRWVAAYGLGRCPTESEARKNRGARNAANYYLRIGGERWEESVNEGSL